MSANEDRKEMEKGMQSLSANREIMEMAGKEIALLFFNRFINLKDAGFTEEQALEIVKARGTS